MELNDDSPIKKTILHPSKIKCDNTNYPDGTKVSFHVKTESCGENSILYDDSRKWGVPVELLLGKKFKLEVWEACVRTMCVGEVAAFIVDKTLANPYPIVAKTLREAYGNTDGKPRPPKPHHCCGMGFKEGLGYADLDQLVNFPQDLKFTIELLTVEAAGSYEKEFWAMNEEERLSSIPLLKEEGNALFKSGQHSLACKKYSEALGRLEQIMLREKPGEKEWNELNEMKIPLLLNFAQCQHIEGDHYSVIEHCTTVLNTDQRNVKALFRRGRAHVNVFNPTEARSDLEEAVQLDPTINSSCQKLLAQLATSEKEKNDQDRNIFKKLFT